MIASTGAQNVLTEEELKLLVEAEKTIAKRLKPAPDAWGKARPWDIEFGFVNGKLWLFQVRPFIGNDLLGNIPALQAYEKQPPPGHRLALDEVIQ